MKIIYFGPDRSVLPYMCILSLLLSLRNTIGQIGFLISLHSLQSPSINIVRHKFIDNSQEINYMERFFKGKSVGMPGILIFGTAI